jgi:heterodisulfide reductase subunit C
MIMNDKLTEKDMRSPFNSEIAEASEQGMADCYQCGKCSAGAVNARPDAPWLTTWI